MSRLIAFTLILAILAACAPGPAATPTGTAASTGRDPAIATVSTTEITVFAAASLTAAFQTMGKNFEAKTPGSRVTFNFAGSQQLAQQIAQGAPADVFASADDQQMSVVVKAGDAVDDGPRTFAHNRLVVVVPSANPAKLSRLQDLARPGVKVILADKSVPVGKYALDFLDRASQDSTFGAAYREAVLKNVVSYEQDVKAVLSKVALGEADAGIVYTTDAIPESARVKEIAIPDHLNAIATYPISAIKGSKHPDLAKRFVAYVLSPDGQAILEKFGFAPVSRSPTARMSVRRQLAGAVGVDGAGPR